MAKKTSVFWRIGRSIKAMILSDEKASTAKRIEFSQKQVDRRDRKKKQGIKQRGYEIMLEDGDLSKDELKKKADRFRRLHIAGISVYRFRAAGLYKMDDDEARKKLYLMNESKKLESELRWDFRLIDLGKLTYDDVADKINDFKLLEAEIMTPEAKREIAEKAGYLHPEDMTEEQISEVAVDMEFTRRILRYSHSGYVEFRFYEKTIPERREFISGKERLLLLSTMNTDESIAILDDKLMTYERLRDHYGRDMISIGSEKDWFRFKAFFDKNDGAVIKPRFDSLGKGIKLIRKSEIDSLQKTFIELIDEYRRFLMEGYITAAPEIRALNPDSVNTVRIIAYYNGQDTSIRSVSMRIGKAGSFVDNAGAGGITVAIDKETGMINSDGCDEKGFRYEKHPDTGITFKGYQLPAWDKALAVVYDVSGKIEGAKYVGWDLACTSDYEWVIVEANGKTGFFGAQAPHDHGRRREFLNTIGADPRGALYNEVALKMAEKVEKQYEISSDEVMEKLRHFESLGIDGRYFEPNRAWELTDEECLELKAAIEARQEADAKREEEMCAYLAGITGIDAETIKHRYHLAGLFGYEDDAFLTYGIYMMDDDEIKKQKYFMATRGSGKRQRRRRGVTLNKIREEKGWSRGRYRLEAVKAAAENGCASDEFALYGIWNKTPEEAEGLCTEDAMHKVWLANASGFESSRAIYEAGRQEADEEEEEDILSDDDADDQENIVPARKKRLHMVTASKDGKPEIIMASLTEGSIKKWSRTGFSAGVDVNTGKIDTDRVNGCGILYENPENNEALKGSDVSFWNEAAASCVEEAAKYPDIRFMRWTAFLYDDGHIEVKNGRPLTGIRLIQTPYAQEGIGLMERFEKYM